MFERIRGAAALGVAALAAALTALFIAPVSATPIAPSSNPDASSPQPAAEQVLTWTADDSVTEYATFPTTATAGPATIVFENSEATGNTTYMSHTLTFDTTNPEYNQDLDLNIVASPNDPNGGRHEVEVNLLPGTYRYYCAIPGHSAMSGILTVTDGGGDDSTPPVVSAEVSGEQDGDGNFVGSAVVTVSASDADSGVASVEYDLDGAGFVGYVDPVMVDSVGDHVVRYRATDNAGNVSEVGSVEFAVVAGEPGTCPDGDDDRDTVWLRDFDTGVPNYDAGDGCTVNDLIDDERDWTEHGAFVRHVGDVTAELVEDDILTSRERSTLIRAAASSEIGKPGAVGSVKDARSLMRL